MDAVLLARVQFAFTISFHIIFPAFTIGLASWLAMLEFLWLRTGRTAYRSLYRFWLKIFAVSFGLGVVSGIVMSFQFGTNWSQFAQVTGNVLGPLLGYEVLTAFFLEATFLGIMLFGTGRVPPWVHFASTCLVALGTLISAFWILAANSWMHTPAGATLRDGVFIPDSWFAIIFNPSFPYRFVHMVLAAYLATCFIIAGVAASHLLRGRFRRRATLTLRLAVIFASIVVPLQIVVGDLHGLNTAEHQPAKVAAIEAHWESRTRAPLYLFAWPNEAQQRNDYAISIPLLGSLILEHDINAQVTGLDRYAPDERPPVAPVFFAFRIMVGIGIVMLVAAWAGLIQLLRGRLSTSRGLLRIYTLIAPLGLVAVIAGWITTEIGRQPWVVYGVMRTADAVSPVAAGSVATTLALFVLVYGAVFGFGLYYTLHLIEAGPSRVKTGGAKADATPARPISAADEPLVED
ncbi:MAG: cytochrome ubiquinol oxidase subunit I [Burkholderiaceae bacterium]